MTTRPGGGDPAVYDAHLIPTSFDLPPVQMETACRTCGEPARFPLAFCEPCRAAILRGERKAS